METAVYFAGTVVGACLIGYFGVSLLGGGVVIGLVLYHKLAIKFQRDADSAWDAAYKKAYLESVEKLNDRMAKRDSFQDGPYPKDKHEDMKTFEESVATMYPNDKKIQEDLIRIKKERDMGGR